MNKKNTNQNPAWLKAIQNGAIGEARAKAFLLDRFWVLERSVDIDGADFTIQRRITNKNLLDREAPRLGVVQVKYFGTPSTQHFIHREYVIDENDDYRNEFFLLCFSGDEQSARSYLILGEDIVKEFPLIDKNGNEGFSINYKYLASNKAYEIINSKLALDRIENRLEYAEFTKNRSFISWALPSSKIDLNAIQPEYNEPIDNWYGDIPSAFNDIKKTAQRAMLKIEEIFNFLKLLTEEADPLKAEEIIEDIAYHCRDGSGTWSISIPNNLDDQDFFAVCKRHKKVYDYLKNDGLLDSFLNMKDELRYRLMQYIEPLIPMDGNSVHLFSFTYDPNTLKILSFDSQIIKKVDFKKNYSKPNSYSLEGITEHSEGCIKYAWLPGIYSN